MSKRFAIVFAGRRSISLLAAVLFVSVALQAGCKKDPIKVLDLEATHGGDFGKAELRAAIDKFRETPTSGAAYRELAVSIAAMRPRLDQANGRIADRMLAFLAIGPMEAGASLPLDVGMKELGATVWPTALGVDPEPDEASEDYIERVCRTVLAGECKFIVPEYWPTLIAAKVWRRLRNRARDRFTECRRCQGDTSFLNTLRRYNELATPVETNAAKVGSDAHPRQWPRAQASAEPWPENIATLEVARSGSLKINGASVASADWRPELITAVKADGGAAASSGMGVGLYVRPDTSVARLRDFLKDLSKLGIQTAHLQVRLPTFPYDLRTYPLATKPQANKRGSTVAVATRGSDTIQVLVLAADQAAKKVGSLENKRLSVF